eukprot:CAMPEP_0173431878 /NCGR_PEP_ID=MMETSP1357-20121228/9872_1 /TAXON_ID=77926 /ORGANISM="Hemiselmis rufescens, Strain PCC563" /LENGTH=56 /DNA_ID=CAMNT_0014396405 /DNA_START=243 /DNA_END=409 /DNA_ORIENTATION=+
MAVGEPGVGHTLHEARLVALVEVDGAIGGIGDLELLEGGAEKLKHRPCDIFGPGVG